MARYPDMPRPNSGYNFRLNWPTVVGGPEWAPQSRALTAFSLLEADLFYRAKLWDQVQILSDFFESVRGSSGRFTFVDFNGIGPIGGADPGIMWNGLFVAQGDGDAALWDLPTFGIKENLTTVVAGIAAGARTVTPASMSHITVGARLTAVDADGTAGESFVVTAVTTTTFSATFANAHAGNWLVGAPLIYEDGVAKQTVVTTGMPGSEPYTIKAGYGAVDGVDALYAFTPPADTVIVTVAALCRRAARRAKFTTVKNPFVLETPAVYQVGTLSVVEVRK